MQNSAKFTSKIQVSTAISCFVGDFRVREALGVLVNSLHYMLCCISLLL